MATQPIADSLISVEEYLSTEYEPDFEYNEGVLEARTLGEFAHSFLQIFLGTIFTNRIAEWGVFALTEQRVQMRPRRYVVPDLTVLRMGSPREPILTRPPLITIEIMSPKDTLKRTGQKVLEYLEFGVENVWVIHPELRVAYRGTRSGLEQVPGGELTVAGTPIMVRISDLFEKLDQF